MAAGALEQPPAATKPVAVIINSGETPAEYKGMFIEMKAEKTAV